MNIVTKYYQFIFHWNDWMFGWVVFDEEKTSLASVYKWLLSIGPFEIRKWVVKNEKYSEM